MKSFDLLTWEHVCTDFLLWISFFTKKCVLSVPVVDFCLFYLTRDYNVEYIPSNRVGPEYGTQNNKFASSGDIADPMDDENKSINNNNSANNAPKRRIISNPQLLYFMLKETVKAPSQSVICMNLNYFIIYFRFS